MKRLSVFLAVLVVCGAAALALTGRWPWRRLEEVATVAPVRQLVVHESHDTLRTGETLDDVFGRQGVAQADLSQLLARAGLDLRRLRAGLIVQFRRVEGDEIPHEVTLRSSPRERLALRRAGTEWSTERRAVVWRTDTVRIEGPIESSLYDALHAAIPDELFDADNRIRLAWDLADVFAWSIDFNRDIQTGDRFAVLGERNMSEESEIRAGAVLAADLLASGKHLNAYRFEDGEGRKGYYDGAGMSLRRAFLRAPVEFRRISSSFTRRRFHPVLGIYRRHEGTDYAAGTGTPVMAAGNGTVLRAGRSGGYGNLVEIRHTNGITTRYGHLKGFARGITGGRRVNQGDVIGYVGATGLASGPHLHYEFRVHGVARDSRRVDLGTGDPIGKALMPLFQESRQLLSRMLTGVSAPVIAE